MTDIDKPGPIIDVGEDDDSSDVSRPRSAALRVTAASAYMTSPEGVTIQELAASPEFADVSVRTLERWSSTDRWVERRQEFLDTWAAETRRRVGSELVQTRRANIDDMREVRAIALQKIREKFTMPKSLEGMIRAFIDLDRREDELTTSIINEFMPPGSEDAPQEPVEQLPPPVPQAVRDLSAAEMADMTTAILARRRQELREQSGEAGMLSAAQDEDDDAAPITDAAAEESVLVARPLTAESIEETEDADAQSVASAEPLSIELDMGFSR